MHTGLSPVTTPRGGESGWLDLNQRSTLAVRTHLFPRQAHYQTMATPSYTTSLPLSFMALAGAVTIDPTC